MIARFFANLAHRMARVRLKYALPAALLLFWFASYMGVFTHLWEKDYHTEFEYPIHGDIG